MLTIYIDSSRTMMLFGENIKTCFFYIFCFDNIRIYFKTFLETDLFYIYISLIKYIFLYLRH
jgi:hypothetical protein